MIVKTVEYKEDSLYQYDFLIFCMLISLFISSKFYVDISVHFNRKTISHCLYFYSGKDMGVSCSSHFMVNACVCTLD